MLGLIQKDIYQMLKYQRVLLLIVIVFAAVSAQNIDNAFFSIYPAVIAGLSMVTLQSYDEQSGFACYSMVMPVSKKTIVGEKYLYGIGMILLVSLVEAVSFLFFQFPILEALRGICFIIAVGLICLSVFLPFIFAYGVERGRTAYVVAMGVYCALTFLIKDRLQNVPIITLGGAVGIGVVLTAVSFAVSVLAYDRRSF